MNCATTYTNGGTLMSAVKASTEAFHKRLRQLYPCVDDVSKLPQAWSTESKAPPLSLTYDNLGCYFRGNGRREEDEKFAAAVRADHHIPPSCLLYYFEIKFISKGREGFMGLGLTSSQALLTKLPGWARESYGYHADDGNIFNGDGRGNQFGPTFTTNDVIGCGYNLVEGKCFFTKNGINLGKAFDDIPSNILFYPTIGLKTPGEEVRANFGQDNFVYDIEQDLRSLRKNMTLTISNYPINDFGNWQNSLHKLVQSWLLQNSYSNTADAFTRSTKIECKENMQRIHQRNRIQQLVLSGRISEAIKLTNRFSPNLLQNNPNLLFALKCRQFIELISGAESEFHANFNYANQDTANNSTATAAATTNINNENNNNNNNNGIEKSEVNGDQSLQMSVTGDVATFSQSTQPHHVNNANSNNGISNGMMSSNNCDKTADNQSASSSSLQELMDIDQPLTSAASANNNTNNSTNNDINNHHRTSNTDPSPSNNIRLVSNNNPTITLDRQVANNNNKSSSSSSTVLEDVTNGSDQTIPIEDHELESNEQKFVKLISFGQELSDHLQQLDNLYGKNETNEKMLQDAISLLAFVDPKNSHFGTLLDPSEREPISQLLNSSILKAEMGDSYKPPLDEVMCHLKKLVRLNDSHGRWLVDRLY